MKPDKTQAKYLKLSAKRDVINAEIQLLKDNCAHLNATFSAKSNTGNYDKGDDSYWHSYHCPSCSKMWDEER